MPAAGAIFLKTTPGLEQARAWRRFVPYAVGAAMFAFAIWVLHATLRRVHLPDVQAELARLTAGEIAAALGFTALSFVALMGYEHSALRLIGRRLPWRKFALASFCTQSIAHSTGFAFVIGATLRYQFYAVRGLTVADIALIQIYFTGTFTLGVSTLAGAVIMLAPERLAAATNLPELLWQGGALVALLCVTGYVLWGALFHRPFVIRGRAYNLPAADATLTQIFWGVADLLAVAGALYALMPGQLNLSYLEVLTVFMTAIVVGLVSNVPGSLGVFESAVILLVQPSEADTLPLIGALLAFRACYYVLPLTLGVTLLAVFELRRLRRLAPPGLARAWRDAVAQAPRVAAALAFVGGGILLIATLTPIPAPRAERLARLPVAVLGLTNVVASTGGLGLLVLARGLALRLARAWRLGIVFVAGGLALNLLTGESLLLLGPLALAFLVLVVARGEFTRPPPPLLQAWITPAWLVGAGVIAALGLWYAVRP